MVRLPNELEFVISDTGSIDTIESMADEMAYAGDDSTFDRSCVRLPKKKNDEADDPGRKLKNVR